MPKKRITNTGNPYKNVKPAAQSISIENNFIGGLKTEFTGLNFPENACTAVNNCVFSLIGDVTRRGGINLEQPTNGNFTVSATNTGAFSSYLWKNAGSDGTSELFVQQVGDMLIFYNSSLAGSSNSGVSDNTLVPTAFNLTSFRATFNTDDPGLFECQYTSGNGVLYVFNPICDVIQFTYDSVALNVSSTTISLQIRDYQGVPDGLGVQGDDPALLTTRPSSLSDEHLYNLLNQGWTNNANASYIATSTSTVGSIVGQNFTIATGNTTFNVGAVSPTPVTGDSVSISGTINLHQPTGVNRSFTIGLTGIVVSYTNPNLVVNITNGFGPISPFTTINSESWTITQIVSDGGLISTWHTAIANYPSNADIWWEYKNTSGAFAPSSSNIINTSLPNTQAPSGHFIINAFDFNRNGAAGGGLAITRVANTQRPTTGTYFAGRVWYSGVTGFLPAFDFGGDLGQYDWSENIYFSQLVVNNNTNAGNCYSVNDPTNENFSDPLPSDGGVISIPGSGVIYKLFPLINGVLVMAQNGIWLISGSAGYGFDPTSYLVSKISSVKVPSGSSVVDVLGFPVFWNQEGIYMVEPSKDNSPYGHGGLTVQPITVGTILSYYNDIPFTSKQFAHGAYNPLTYTITWVYKSTQETGISDRYIYDTALTLNIYNKAFYPYTIATSPNYVTGICYVDYPSSPLTPQFKYQCVTGPTTVSLAEENDFTQFKDWAVNNYVSSFTTGYKLHGQVFKRWQPIYLYMFLRNNTASEYTVNAIWDFNNNAIGRSSIPQTITSYNPKFNMLFRRHKLRGHGLAVQFNVSSVDSKPFDFMGWAVPEQSAIGA